MTCTCKPYYECPECEPEHYDFTVDSLAAALQRINGYSEAANQNAARNIIQAAKEAERYSDLEAICDGVLAKEAERE